MGSLLTIAHQDMNQRECLFVITSCCWGCIGGSLVTLMITLGIVYIRFHYLLLKAPGIIPCLLNISDQIGMNVTEVDKAITDALAWHHYNPNKIEL